MLGHVRTNAKSKATFRSSASSNKTNTSKSQTPKLQQHQAFQQKQIETLRHMKDNSNDFSELINQNLATQQSRHAIPEISKNQSCEQKSSEFQIQDHGS